MTGGTLSYDGRRRLCLQQQKQKRTECGVGNRLNTWKSEDAYSKVPSPPRQIIKSTRLEMSSRSKRYVDNSSFKSLILKKEKLITLHVTGSEMTGVPTFSESAEFLCNGRKVFIA